MSKEELLSWQEKYSHKLADYIEFDSRKATRYKAESIIDELQYELFHDHEFHKFIITEIVNINDAFTYGHFKSDMGKLLFKIELELNRAK